MRLDKWLKVSRLIKRRTVANEACDNGRVTANGRGVKASYEVKPGDVLEQDPGLIRTGRSIAPAAEQVGHVIDALLRAETSVSQSRSPASR